jgi:exopolysaccharide biosynthesis protein
MKKFKKWMLALLTAIFSLVSMMLIMMFLCWGVLQVGTPKNIAQENPAALGIMDRFDMQMTNQISNALDGVLSIEKVYWLNDSDLIAPEPNPEKAGVTTNPADLADFLEEAKDILKGQETLFSTQTKTYQNTEIHYYLDETIMVITWREVRDRCVYTISEVKIAHPSQFRRFVSDGVYGSDKRYLTTEMAETVNAVTASSGDYYKFRPYGISVHEGQVMRFDNRIDTCYITDQGDMIFSRIGELNSQEEAQKFVDDNHVRFSVSFGPILVDNYEKVDIKGYPLGEPEGWYPRAALCKMDELHYLVVLANEDPGRGLTNVPTIKAFGDVVYSFGVEKAYALDGGQTAAVVTNDKLVNRPSYGYQRAISDIIYFATAVPNGG